MKTKDKYFIRGYACAVVTMVRGWRNDHLAKMIIEEGSYTLDDFVEAECDDFDMETVKKLLKD